MLDWLAAALLLSLNGSVSSPCPEEDDDYHAPGVCANWLDGAPAYAVTYRRSLSPGPASEEVMLTRLEGQWLLLISGYSWRAGKDNPVLTRRTEREIREADAARLIALTNDATLTRLRELPYYGDENRICTDGTSLHLSSGKDGTWQWVGKHSCSDRTELNEIAAAFREVALKYDPEMEGLLGGFRLRQKE